MHDAEGLLRKLVSAYNHALPEVDKDTSCHQAYQEAVLFLEKMDAREAKRQVEFDKLYEEGFKPPFVDYLGYPPK